jgi:hypothetical protein
MAIGRILSDRRLLWARAALDHPANRAHLEVAKAARKARFLHGSHAISAWQQKQSNALENMAKIRLSMSYFDVMVTVLGAAFSTRSETDFSVAETDSALGNVRLSC